MLESAISGRSAASSYSELNVPITLWRPVEDNGDVPYIPMGLIHQGELQEAINKAKSALGHEVCHIAYRIGEDNTGTPSIFFRITMQDFAMTEATVSNSTARVTTALFNQIRPLENWGLRPYFNFRSVSDQQKRPDPDWL